MVELAVQGTPDEASDEGPQGDADPDGHRAFQFSLRALLAVTTVACISVGLVVVLGEQGVAFALDGMVLLVGGANLTEQRRLFDIRFPKLTVVEFLVCVLICLVLHAILLPAVQSSHHPRRTNSNAAPKVNTG